MMCSLLEMLGVLRGGLITGFYLVFWLIGVACGSLHVHCLFCLLGL